MGEAEAPVKYRRVGGAVQLLVVKYSPSTNYLAAFHPGLTKNPLATNCRGNEKVRIRVTLLIEVEVVSGCLATVGSQQEDPTKGRGFSVGWEYSR